MKADLKKGKSSKKCYFLSFLILLILLLFLIAILWSSSKPLLLIFLSSHLRQGPKPAGSVGIAHHCFPQLRTERIDRALFKRETHVCPPLQRPPHKPHVLKHHGESVVVLGQTGLSIRRHTSKCSSIYKY